MLASLLRSILGRPHRIVGVWYVDAVAPYRPHQFTFLETEPGVGVLFSTNPTNVQDGPGASVPVTDSVGMGVWAARGDEILGTMYQENALQPARTRGPRLAVTFRVRLRNNDLFEGPAVAQLIDPVSGHVIEEPESYLVGERLRIRWGAMPPPGQ